MTSRSESGSVAPAQAGHRWNNFDFVRVLAALCVLLSHQFALNGLPEPVFLKLHSLGGVGVLIFFTISGFLVAQSWHADPHVGRFAARRLLRIWPGLAVLIVLAALVWGPLVSSLSFTEYFRHPQLPTYFNNLRFSFRDGLPLRFEGNALPTAVDGALWTIPLELKCYLALALFGIAGLLRRRWVVPGLTVLVLTAYAIVEPRGDRLVAIFDWTLENRFLVEFGLFFFAAVALWRLNALASGRRAMLLTAAGWTLGAAAVAADRPLLGLWCALPITVLAFGTASLPYLRRAGRFGDLSYGLYIYAFPVQQTLIWLLKDKLPWGAVLALTLLVTFTLAFASWHLVEKRALRLKPRKRRIETPPAFEPAEVHARS
jgi:peptidoglycan/LPS O-acetylase OafA/YrhL